MPSVTIRNVPDEVHRAIRIRAARHGRSTEAEIRIILERAAKPKGRVKLGSLLVSLSHKNGGLTDDEHALLNKAHDNSPARTASFE